MTLRSKNIEGLEATELDVLVIGGGINGAVSASALAARGVKVGLIDSRDFAGFTSQHSSNLIWGGIKYLESFEIGLVNDLCQSRNELLSAFPSTVKEIRFLTTLSRHFRLPRLIMLAGTWLYWLFGRARTATPKLVSRRRIKNLEPLVNTANCSGGIEYSDAMLHDNDARFVFNFVRSAMDNGCLAANYVKATSINRDQQQWHVQAEDQTSGKIINIRSKILINATGAYVDEINQQAGIKTNHRHVFSKGIHLIVPRISRRERVLAFFADDGRLFFAIPMAHRTCIGTTDTLVEDQETGVTDEDRQFVLDNINARLDLERPLSLDDIISERCGVRPLAVDKGPDATEDFLHLSRHHQIEVDQSRKHISIFGGKLTDCLNVGDEIANEVEALGVALAGKNEKWYGEPSLEVRTKFFKTAHRLGLDQSVAVDTGEALSERLWRRYGIHALKMLEAIEQDASLAEPLVEGSGIRGCEIEYLKNNEMIVKLEDYLRRRSKLALIQRKQKLAEAKGMRELCDILFGEQASHRYDEYFGESGGN